MVNQVLARQNMQSELFYQIIHCGYNQGDQGKKKRFYFHKKHHLYLQHMIQHGMRANHQTTDVLAWISPNPYWNTESDDKTILWLNDPSTRLGCEQLGFNPFSSEYFIFTVQNNFSCSPLEREPEVYMIKPLQSLVPIFTVH